MLITKSPPTVSLDTHDHAGRDPNASDAARVHTPIASSASATGQPRATGSPSAPSSARAHRQKCTAITSARSRNRSRQSRTVSPGTPSRSATRR